MRKPLPETLSLGEMTYRVRVAPRTTDPQHWAETNHLTKEIQIAPFVLEAPDHTAAVLLHEAVHIAAWHYDVDLAESEVIRLANGLYAVLCQADLYPRELLK